MAPLTHEIKTGDRVEILTNKSSKPSRDWLKIVKTPSAKSKIRRYFAAATKDDDAAAGRDMLAKDLRKRGYGISTPRSTRALNAVAEQFNFKQLEDLFAAVGAGKVAPRAVGNKVEQILDPKPEEQLTKPKPSLRSSSSLPAVPTANRKSVARAQVTALSSRARATAACWFVWRIAAIR